VSLAPFPVDDTSLDLVMRAINPPPEEQAECSSLYSALEFFSELGGSDTSAVAEEYDDDAEVRVLRDPQYSVHCLVSALIEEIRRLRGRREELAMNDG
jgi:hypothetical protein